VYLLNLPTFCSSGNAASYIAFTPESLFVTFALKTEGEPFRHFRLVALSTKKQAMSTKISLGAKFGTGANIRQP
jgi:hypothetical protein